METPEKPENESERLLAIDNLDILDTPPESAFDDLTRLASLLCGTLFATVTIVDEERQWFKSAQGPLEARETSRDVSFCGHALNSPELFIIEDALNDPRFADNPLVQGGPRIRFYAGAPLILDQGLVVGTLCVFDPQPKSLNAEQRESLALLAKQVTDRLKHRVSDSIADNLNSILDLGKTNLIVFDPVQERAIYLNPALRETLKETYQPDTRKLFARLFPDVTYERFFSIDRMNDSDMALRKVTQVCLPGRPPGKAELSLFRTARSDRSTCILAFHDQTEISRAHDSAEQANSDLRVFHQLARQSKNAFIVAGADGLVQWVNSSFERKSGYTLSEIKGSKPGDFLQGTDTSAFDKQRISRHLREQKPVVQEILNYTKSGDPYWTELYIEPIRDNSGMLTHFVATQTDTTESRQENLLLKESRARAERANRVKSQFLAEISHELRTPMNGIIGITEKLLRELPSEFKASAETLDQSSQHLMRVLDDLLDLSNIESGKFELSQAPFELPRLLRDVEQLFAPRSELVRSRLLLTLDPDMPAWVEGDEVRLKQVLINLVSNAVKFTIDGTIEISVSVVPSDVDGNKRRTLRFSVKDDGPGIAAEDQSRIFQSFEQLDNSSTRTHGGTGLGLAISRQLVEAMKGTLSLTSEPGEGATFFFEISLPISEQPIDTNESASTTTERGEVLLDHALVIDDNEVNCKVLHDLLKRLGFSTVHTAQSARRGLAVLDNIQPDIVFLDLQMPDMNGLELITHMQQQFLYQRRAMPVMVACTANVSDEVRRKCLAAGFDAHLAKPVTGASLQGLLDKLGRTVGDSETQTPHGDDGSNQRQGDDENKIVIDHESLLNSFLDNEDLLKDFLSLLIENLPQHSARIGEAVASGAVTSHSDAAHSIKGLVGYFKNSALINAAEDLEQAMILGDHKKTKTVFQILQTHLAALDREVRALLQELHDR